MFFDPLVVVTMMTTAALIITLLDYAAPPSGGISGKTIMLCFVIGAVGLITIILQMRAVVKAKRIREKLAQFYDEGRAVSLAVRSQMEGCIEPFSDWRGRVIKFLKENLDNSYVTRFETANMMGEYALLEFIKELN